VNYDVYWSPTILEQLQGIHDTASDQEGIRNTITRIELELGSIPHEAGESRDGNFRILFKFPLVVWYRIDERLRQVVITDVRPFGN
jgi:hypothetical protein